MDQNKKFVYVIGPISYSEDAVKDREIKELAALVREVYAPELVVTPADLRDVNIKTDGLDFRELREEALELQKYTLGWLSENCFLVVSYLPKPSSGRTFEQYSAMILDIPVIGYAPDKVRSPHDLVGVRELAVSKEELKEVVKSYLNSHS